MVKNIIDLIEASGAEYIGIRHLMSITTLEITAVTLMTGIMSTIAPHTRRMSRKSFQARAHTIPRYIPDGTSRMKSSQSWKKPLTHPKYTMEILLSSAETVLPMVMTRAKSS